MCLLVDNLKQHPCLLQTATKKSLCVPSSIHYTMPGPTVNFKTDLINAREQNFKGKIYKNPGKIPTTTYIVYSFSNIFPHFFIHIYFSEHKKKLQKLYGPYLCLKARPTSRRQFTFYHQVPRNSWYSSYQPRKDERLSPPSSHPVIFGYGTSGLGIQHLNHWAIAP